MPNREPNIYYHKLCLKNLIMKRIVIIVIIIVNNKIYYSSIALKLKMLYNHYWEDSQKCPVRHVFCNPTCRDGETEA